MGNDVSAAFLTETRAPTVRAQPFWGWGFMAAAPSVSPTSSHAAHELWRPLSTLVPSSQCTPTSPATHRLLPACTPGYDYPGQAAVWWNQLTSLPFDGKTIASPMRSPSKYAFSWAHSLNRRVPHRASLYLQVVCLLQLITLMLNFHSATYQVFYLLTRYRLLQTSRSGPGRETPKDGI